MPVDWEERVRELLAKDDHTEKSAKRRDNLKLQLKRLNYQFERGLISEEDTPEYETKAQRLIQEINRLVTPSADKSVELGKRVIGFPSAWAKSTPIAKHELLKEVFEAVLIDANTKKISGVVPYAELLPILKQTHLIEERGVFVLKKDLAAELFIQRLDARPAAVSHGRDGIRTRGLCLDRAAC